RASRGGPAGCGVRPVRMLPVPSGTARPSRTAPWRNGPCARLYWRLARCGGCPRLHVGTAGARAARVRVASDEKGERVADLVNRFLNFKRGEVPLAVTAALFYFFVLCGYSILRPVREAMGVSRGMDDLRWLWFGTSLASLAIVLMFGDVVSRLDRRRFIPVGYLFVIACLGG